MAAAGMRLRLAKPVMTGYRGVRSNGFKRFTAEHRSNGKRTHLGTFDTAMEAAVAYAKCVQLLNAPKADARAGDHNDEEDEELDEEVMEVEEVVNEDGVVEEAAGMRLHLANRDSSTGYRGVRPHQGRFQAKRQVDGKHTYLGMFDTAVEAAVAYAKHEQSLGLDKE